jgi:hypothetical protein
LLPTSPLLSDDYHRLPTDIPQATYNGFIITVIAVTMKLEKACSNPADIVQGGGALRVAG